MRVSGIAEDCPANPVVRIFKRLTDDSPSPWGEGRDEGVGRLIPDCDGLTGGIERLSPDVEALIFGVGALTGDVETLIADVGGLIFNVEALTFDVFGVKFSRRALKINHLREKSLKTASFAQFPSPAP